jgi:hypothetical protein
VRQAFGADGPLLVEKREGGQPLATVGPTIQGAHGGARLEQRSAGVATGKRRRLDGERRKEGNAQGADEGQGGDAPQQVRQ